MPQSACPFCFNRVDTSRLAYQCTNRGTSPCTKGKDEVRIKVTGNVAESFPTFEATPARGQDAVCSTCEGPARRRACPACHTAVPYEFIDSSSPMFAIVGPKGSGKTVLMTVLGKVLRERVSSRFGASVRLAGDDPDMFESLDDYVAGREAALFDKGTLPMLTAPAKAQNRRPVMMLWQGRKKRMLGGQGPYSAIMSFVDTAGEDLQDLNEAFTLRYLNVADGLIIVLDPFAMPGAQDTINLPSSAIQSASPMDVLGRITEVLRTDRRVKRGKKIKLPVAIVFTKIDAFFSAMDPNNPLRTTSKVETAYDDKDGESVHEHMKSLLYSWGAEEIDTHLNLNYAAFRYFGVSALGAEPNYDRLTLAAGGVRPHRVEDPLLWLLAKEGAVQSV